MTKITMLNFFHIGYNDDYDQCQTTSRLISMMDIWFQTGLNTKTSSARHRFSPWSFPVSSICSTFQNLVSYFSKTFWIFKPRKMSLQSRGLGWEVSRSFPCFCSFLNVTPEHFQTAGGGRYICKTNPFFFCFNLSNLTNLF